MNTQTIAASIEDDVEDLDDRLLLHDLEQRLIRRAKLKVRRAMAIQCMLTQGFRPGEIRQRTGMSARDYTRAHGWLEDALREHRAL